MSQEISTIQVLADRLPEAQKALDKLVRKAARYGCGDIAYTVGETHKEERAYTRWDGSKGKVTTSWVALEVTGEAPRVGNHEFLASIEVGPAGNIVDTKPGVEGLHESFRHSTGRCDHCKMDRARKHVFAVRDIETGEQLQIGRTCLRDFMGIDDPKSVAHRFAFWKALSTFEDDDDWGLGHYSFTESVESVLALTATCIRLFGWASKGQALDSMDIIPTVDHVTLGLGSRPRPTGGRYGVSDDSLGQLWDKIHKTTSEQDWDVAREVVAWLRELEPKSDYEHNLVVVCGVDHLNSEKRLGLVCSAVSAYQRAQERQVRRTREQSERAASQWVGAEGERLKGVEATLTRQQVIGSSQWGDRLLVGFKDAEGNELVWFTGAGTELQVGEQCVLAGTVKSHGEFNDVRQTVLSRVKVS